MKPLSVSALLLALSAFVSLPSDPLAAPGTSGVDEMSMVESTSVIDADVIRIQAHLLRVERSMRTRDVAHLTPEQRAARSRLLGWLGEYRRAGRFPHNHTHPGERVPVFVDRHATPCAVGYLLLRSGERELVESVVGMDNNVRVAELAENGVFQRWLEESGLDLDEAVRIQPTYEGPPLLAPETDRDYRIATLAVSAASLGATAWSALTDPPPERRDWAAWADVGVGIGHGILTAVGSANDEEGWAIGLNAAAALTTAAVGLDRLFPGGPERSPAVVERVLPDGVSPVWTGRESGVVVRWSF